MATVLLDRDGVVVVNRKDNIKTADQLRLIPGAAQAIGDLNRAGVTVGLCTNQPEVARGAMTRRQLDVVHDGLRDKIAAEGGGHLDLIFVCTDPLKCPRRKPAPGMLLQALAHFGAAAADTPFVGDQADDLRAAFRAGCQRVLVRTGLGSMTLAAGLPDYVAPFAVHDDLAGFVGAYLAQRH